MNAKLITLRRGIWLFPLILLLILVVLSVGKISGSSVGKYNTFFYGIGYHDPNLLYGQPQSIRSDEWLVTTPLVVAQVRNHFHDVNPNIGDGQDLSVETDVPHKDVFELFQPQNWSFFVLPLEVAFAFKWWLLGVLLIVSCYLFVLEVLPSKKSFAMLLSLGLFFSPYIQWWYQTITIAPLFYGFFILIVLNRLFRSQRRRDRFWWSILLAYLATCFALIQYPAFQIPVALAVAAVFIGTLLEQRKTKKSKTQLKESIAGALAAVIIAGGITFAFLASHSSIVKTIAATVYPGHRVSENLRLTLWHLLSGFLVGQLQNLDRAIHYIANQSEASNFILISPFLLLPSGYIVYRSFKRKTEQKYVLLFLNLLLVIFIWRFTIEITGSGTLSSLLKIIPNQRILLGIGFVGFLQMIILAREQVDIRYSRLFIRASTLLTFIVTLVVGFHIRRTYPGYISSGVKIIGLAFIFELAFYLIIKKRIATAAACLLVLCFYSSYNINPLYRGLGPLTHSQLSQRVEAVNKTKPGAWIVVDSLEYNTYLPANGIKAYSGVYTYPQLGLWKQIDTNGQYKNIYNRYAQVIFSSAPPAPFYLVQLDWFDIQFEACSPFVQKNVSYIMSVHPLTSECLSPLAPVKYPARTFYLYKVTP